MKTLKAPNWDEARNEGRTQVELAAEIRRRAYKLYEERGKTDGHALEDWAQAEAEILRGGMASPSSKRIPVLQSPSWYETHP